MIFLISILSLPFIANADCSLLETSYIYQQKEILKKEKVCLVELEKIKFYMSEKCLHESDVNSSVCSWGFKNLLKNVVMEKDDIRTGTPGFKLCRALNGTPQIFSVIRSGIKEETDRCFFSEDRWFEISWLMKKYLKK